MENQTEEAKQEEKKEEELRAEEIEKFAKNTLPNIKRISDWYKNFFESNNGNPAIVAEIEQKIGNIKTEYESLFVAANEKGETKIAEINSKFNAIKNFHSQLLDGEKSISSGIKEAQSKINEFFQYLFGAEGVDGEEKKIKNKIEEITNFHIELTKDDGIQKKVADAHKEIVEKHSELFSGTEEQKSKFQELTETIEKIEEFNKKIDDEITPNVENVRGELGKLKIDYETKSNEVGSLLSNATVRTLAQGYLESMQKYGFNGFRNTKQGVQGEHKKSFNLNWNQILGFLGNVLINFLNYALFIIPLVSIAAIFIEPNVMKSILKIQSLGGTTLIGSQYIFYKISVSIPLLWVSWLGQRNISQRKRLFEEYNHKLRVVQMYLMFISKDSSYELDNLKILEEILLEVIRRNPSEVYGEDETMLDKIIEIIKARKSVIPIPKEVSDAGEAIKNLAKVEKTVE